MDATYHTAKDIIYALQNPAPASPLVKLGHGHKESLKTLTNTLRKANPPAVPQRAPVREAGHSNPQEMNQEGNQMKSTPQSNTVTNS